MKRLLLVQLDIDECHNLSRTDLEDAVTCTLGILQFRGEIPQPLESAP